jgi:hypothetical protein
MAGIVPRGDRLNGSPARILPCLGRSVVSRVALSSGGLPESVSLRLPSLADVTSAMHHRQARIFGEGRIGVGEFTAIKRRSARRVDSLGVQAVDT